MTEAQVDSIITAAITFVGLFGGLLTTAWAIRILRGPKS